MEIIKAEEKHIPELVELWKAFMKFHEPIDPRFPMRKDVYFGWEKTVRELMKSEDTQVLVALDKRRIVGLSVSVISKYAPIWERETYGAIDTLAVTSEYRRKGIGQQMVAKIFDWFESKNIHRIELSVAAGNQVSNSFWKKNGFKDYIHRLYLDR